MLDLSLQSRWYSTGVGSWIFCWTRETLTGFYWLFQGESGLWFQSNSKIVAL